MLHESTHRKTDEVLVTACARNTPAEIHHRTTADAVTVARTRLMGVDEEEGQLLAEVPRCASPGSRIPVDAPVSVHFSLDRTRYRFVSAIVDDRRRIRLNEHRTVPGIALRLPDEVERSQRRSALRILTIRYDPILVVLAPPHPEHPEACAVDGPAFRTWMVDLSMGGMGVLVDTHVLPTARTGETFYALFRLPQEQEPFCPRVVVRHVRPARSGDSLRVGLAFQNWRPRALRRDQQRIARFVARHERDMLRRRRGHVE